MLITHGTSPDDVFIEHPLIRKDTVEQRDFQTNIAKECLAESTLVVLPTGLGKTVIALIVIANVLSKKEGKILFMAPTKPLVDQHAAFLRKNLLVESISSFTGEVPPETREDIWKSSRIVVSTPQVVENDVDAGRLNLKGYSLVVFDEAHRAVGDYAYVRIGAKYSIDREDGLALGMTASPGYDLEKIGEVCRNLAITNIAVRSELDEDVSPYVFGIKIEWIRVDVPEGVDEMIVLLQKILDEKIDALRKYHVLDPKRRPGTRDLLTAGEILRVKVNANRKNYHLWKAITIQASAIKVNHAIDLVRTQGRGSLTNYLQKIVNDAGDKKGSRASKELMKDARFEMVRRLLDTGGEDHPKLDKLKEIVSEQLSKKPESKIIVFTHYRDTCDNVTGILCEVANARPVRFVGQASKGADTGMKQKEQKEIIEQFKSGGSNVLVATSVAEEGLDLPSTDLVVFYEPVPSEIRTIQRRGRTGRHSPGRVVMLLARDTKDEAYLYSSKRKEAKMHLQLDSLRRRLKVAKKVGADTGEAVDVEGIFEESEDDKAAERKAASVSKSQTLLTDFGALSSSGLRLVASKERNKDVLNKLKEVGIRFDESKTQLEDFVIGDEIAVVRESIDKFLHDIERPELASKIAVLRDRYRRPIIIVEGGAVQKSDMADKLPIYDVMNSLIHKLMIPVMPTAGVEDTSAFIASLVKIEMGGRKNASSGGASEEISEYQKRMIQGLPNVTSVLAERLLEKFGSVQNVLAASAEELMSVDGVGKVIADGIKRTATDKYGPGRNSSLDSFD